MCNLYTTPSADEFEKYMRQLDQVVQWQEPDWDTKPVGPFGMAPFVVADGNALRLKGKRPANPY